MHDAPYPDLVLYGRAGCGLCDETRTLLVSLLDERARAGLPAPTLVERDIETDPAWERAYFASDPALELAFFDRIPVVELNGRRVELAIGPAKLRRILAEGLDG